MPGDHASTTVFAEPGRSADFAVDNEWEYCQLMLVRERKGKREVICRLAYCQSNTPEVALGKPSDAGEGVACFRQALGVLGRAGWELADIEMSFDVELGGQVHFPSAAALTGHHSPSTVGATAWLKRPVLAGRPIDDCDLRSTGPGSGR